MSGLVLDCSAAVCLVLPDESSSAVHAVVADVAGRGLLVPSLWWYECTNVLLTAVRQGRVEIAEAREALSLLSRLPRETRDASSLVDAVHLFHLATRFGITSYDAAYLALAEIAGATLLTLDRRLHAAAQALGVDVIIAPPAPDAQSTPLRG